METVGGELSIGLSFSPIIGGGSPGGLSMSSYAILCVTAQRKNPIYMCRARVFNKNVTSVSTPALLDSKSVSPSAVQLRS